VFACSQRTPPPSGQVWASRGGLSGQFLGSSYVIGCMTRLAWYSALLIYVKGESKLISMCIHIKWTANMPWHQCNLNDMVQFT